MAACGDISRIRSAIAALLDEAFVGPAEGAEYGEFTTGPGSGILGTLEGIRPDVASAAPYGERPSIVAHAEHVRLSLETQGDEVVADVDWNAAWRRTAPDANALGELRRGLEDAYLATRRRLLDGPWSSDHDIRRALAAVVHTAYHLGAMRQTLRLLEAEDAADAAIHLTAFTPYERALAGLDPARALKVPPGAPYCVAQVLAHMVFWQDWLTAAVRGEPRAFPEHAETGWPAPCGDAWPALVERFLAGLAEARTMSQDAACRHRVVGKGEPGGRLLSDLAVHNAHHLGEIILLRRLNGDWPPPGGGDSW